MNASSENGKLSREVLVYRYPGLHFGDIHVFRAILVPDLEKNIAGFSKYVVLFPIPEPRSLVNVMAGGDFDGDNFSRNPQGWNLQLVQDVAFAPSNYGSLFRVR